ncbi:MAG: methyltransferase domain-containing protein [Verrucomicrobiota bacterium]|nr:methyltransferase domain-containing protein [Verrucomicrobiota bacterium]
MKNFLFVIFEFLSRVFSRLSRVSLGLALRSRSNDIQRRSVIFSTRHDMVKAPEESFYAEQYWQTMLPHLSKLPQDAKILDLGCGQGRFLVKLGKLFTKGQIVGCDLSEGAIAQAKGYVAQSLKRNIDLRVQSISDCLNSFGEKSIDAALVNEVTFFYPDWKLDLPQIIKVLKPGGFIIISFRPQYFSALQLIRERLWSSIETLLQKRQGRILGSSTIYTWHTSKEIKMLFDQEYDLTLLELKGVGVCSGIAYDPHDYICQPSLLNAQERKQLMKLELEFGKDFPDGGRYMLAVACKSK